MSDIGNPRGTGIDLGHGQSVSERIFILEDNKERLQWFSKIFEGSGCTLEVAETVEKARELLSNNKYSMLFLDHDLGGEQYVDIEHENTGTQLVKWLIDNMLQKQSGIVIHSQNPVGSTAMFNMLDITGYQVLVIPFTQLYHEYQKHLEEEAEERGKTV